MDEIMKLRKSLLKAGIITYAFLASISMAIAGVEFNRSLAEHPVFSPQFAAYLQSRATTEYQQQIVIRILDLEVEIDQAKEIISRVPFLEVDERLHLFRLLDKRYQKQIEEVENDSKDGRFGFISLGEESERRKILKKFLLTKVKTEEDYEQLISSFDTNLKVLDLFMNARDFKFLNEDDLKLAKKIAHGQLEAYFNQTVKTAEYAQQLEISSVDSTGFTLDLAKQAGEYGRYRHQFRSASTYKGHEIYAEVAVEAGNQSLRGEDNGQLEYFKLEWKGDKSAFIVGDQMPDLSSAALNREIRGLLWSRQIDGKQLNELSVFAGVTPVSIQEVDRQYEEWIRSFGFAWNKGWKNGKSIGAYYINAKENRTLGDRNSQIIGLNHSARLSRQLSLSMDLNRSYGDQLFVGEGATGVSFGLDYLQDELSAAFEMKRFESNYFSLLGQGIPATVEMDAHVRRYESWGSWRLFGHFIENQRQLNVVSLETLRPGFNIHLNNFMGLNNLHADYGYDESREESEDLTVLFESNNHWLQLSRTFHRLKFDMSINYRESFDKNISPLSDKESQVRFATHGHFLLNGRAISPLIELSSHRQELINGRVDNRQQGAVQLTSQILKRGQVFSRYDFWKSDSELQFQDQQGQSFQLSFDYPFSRDWHRSFKVDFNWEEQKLNDQLSFGAFNELKLSYNKRF
tara:strand:+ start:202 stop:2262 length:2061 start_codon:yes stop_codon:yes gene_type:complete